MKSKLIVRIAGIMMGAAVLGSIAADELPETQSFARYESMLRRSPFAVATAAVEAPAATPISAKDLYVVSMARTRDGDVVTIGSRTDKNFKKVLTSKAPVDGY